MVNYAHDVLKRLQGLLVISAVSISKTILPLPCEGYTIGLWLPLDCGLKKSAFDTWPGLCVVFLSKALNFHCTSLHPGV